MRFSRQDWIRLIQEQEQSDLNIAQFARERGIRPKYFYLRRSQFKGDVVKARSGFVAVNLPRTAAVRSCVLRVGDAVLEVSDGTSPQWLAGVMRALA